MSRDREPAFDVVPQRAAAHARSLARLVSRGRIDAAGPHRRGPERRPRLLHFELFGWSHRGVDVVREFVADALGIEFEHHISRTAGEYHLAGLPGSEHFELRANRDARGRLAEPDFAGYRTLLYVNETTRPQEIARSLAVVAATVRLQGEGLLWL